MCLVPLDLLELKNVQKNLSWPFPFEISGPISLIFAVFIA